MKYWLIPLVIYIAVSLLCPLSSIGTSPENNIYTWKLVVFQIYALPLLAIMLGVSLIIKIRNGKKSA
ncbi:DUF4017 family protein [Sporolactobacillus sp. Y61]|uniref:DUF4017 family protein n=1 Tax=Sporolactobacillus sp. Y61 TaxID=3160863 RepID=A0AAU8IHJ6_9BACL|nr:DUF4017 domain-containing protein [Sporolactobacillus sp. THM19-2]